MENPTLDSEAGGEFGKPTDCNFCPQCGTEFEGTGAFCDMCGFRVLPDVAEKSIDNPNINNIEDIIVTQQAEGDQEPSPASVELYCPQCGKANTAESAFCWNCATKFPVTDSPLSESSEPAIVNTPKEKPRESHENPALPKNALADNNTAQPLHLPVKPVSKSVANNVKIDFVNKLIPLSAILLFLIVGAAAYYFYNTAGVNRQIDLGNKYLAAGEYKQAIDTFNKVVAKNPDNMPAIAGLAQACIGNGDYDQAKKIIIAVQEPDESILVQYLELITVFIEQGDFEEAQQILSAAQAKFEGDKKIMILADYLQVKKENAETAVVHVESETEKIVAPIAEPEPTPTAKPPVKQNYPKDSVSGIY